MIIEDNLMNAKQVSSLLVKDGYETRVYLDGESALAELTSFGPDLILLDYYLPGKNAPELCMDIRAVSSVPIIIVSANTRTEDKIQLLELGSDDYVEKPFDSGELKARVHAVLRRYSPQSSFKLPESEAGEYVEYPGLFISQTSYTVRYDGEPLTLPPKELELLYCLASSPNRVFTREQLLDYVWGYDYMGDPRTVDVHIKRLREKIKDHETWSLSTVWGVGYKFSVTA